MPTVDTYGMNVHLAEIRRSVSAEGHVALVLDGAGWHASKGLRVPDDITLLPRPPYSPERNGREPGWLYLKSHSLAHRVYPDPDALFAAGCDAWNRYTQDPTRVRSVCHAQGIESPVLNEDWYYSWIPTQFPLGSTRRNRSRAWPRDQGKNRDAKRAGRGEPSGPTSPRVPNPSQCPIRYGLQRPQISRSGHVVAGGHGHGPPNG